MKYLKNFRNDEVIKFINSSDLDFIQDCINRGIDINIHGRNGWNILLYSCRFKNIDVIKLLIKNGANVNETNGGLFTPLHMSQFYIEKEIINEDIVIEIIIELLKAGADISLKDKNGQTPINTKNSLVPNVWKNKTIQDIICDTQAQNIEQIKDIIDPEIKQKYIYLFSANSAGLL